LICCQGAGSRIIKLVKQFKGSETIIGSCPVKPGRIYLKIDAQGQSYSFYATTEVEMWIPVAERVDGRILSTTVAGGFVGTYIGMYCSSNGQSSENYVDFDWFEYTPQSND
jgi:alpha-N-arabinofuranosidase